MRIFKHNISKLLLLMIKAVVVLTVNGQVFRPAGRYIFSPAHPLEMQQVYIREDAFEKVFEKYNAIGEELPHDAASSYKVIRSEDGLTDIIYYSGGVVTTSTCIYDISHKLISEKVDYGLPYYIYYIYDQKGRVKSTTYCLESELQGRTSEYIHTYLDDQTVYTDSGYVFTMIEEERRWPKPLENPDSIIIKKDTLVTEYVFDTQNRLIRAGNERYAYLESGEIICTNIYDSEKNTKYESSYNKNGLRQKTNRYLLRNGVWELEDIEKVFYYKDGVPVSTELVTENILPVVYGTRGGVILTAETEQPVRIYIFNGQLIKQVNAVPDQLIPLPRGVYIVVVGSQSCKVVVR